MNLWIDRIETDWIHRLPISLGIVESHGGKLKVQSQESKGTKVIIELPVMENDMEQ